MKLETNLKNGVKQRILSALVPVLAMYVIWCSVAQMMVAFGGLGLGGGWADRLVFPLCLLIYLGLALVLSQIFMVYVDGALNEVPIIRGLIALLTLIVGGVVYILSHQGGGATPLWVSSLGTANLIVFACVTATWMVHSLKRPSELVPICGVFAIADLFSVTAGPTRFMVQELTAYYHQGMQGPPPFIDLILIKITVPGVNVAMPLFGVSDWLILVFLCAALSKFELNDNLLGVGLRTMIHRKRLNLYVPAAFLGLLISIVSAQLFGVFLPALPFVAITFLGHAMIVHPRIRHLNKREWALLSGFSSVMILILVVGILFKSG